MRPILIVGALVSETDYIISKIENVKESDLVGYKFYEGFINDYPVALIKTEVGLVNAAMSVTLAIEKCNPALIINEGTAGGITENYHMRDIIIGKETFNIMACMTPYKELGEGSNSLEWDYKSFFEGGNHRKVIYEGNEELINFVYALKDEYKKGNVYIGRVGSGDVWNREKDRLKYYADVHNVDCEDMEAVAIYSVANKFDIPVLGIKIMSDNELLGETYMPEVASDLQEFVYLVISEAANFLKD